MKDKTIQVRSTPEFKLQCKSGKNIQGIHLEKQFQFNPKTIFIERVINKKNTFVVRAPYFEEEHGN